MTDQVTKQVIESKHGRKVIYSIPCDSGTLSLDKNSGKVVFANQFGEVSCPQMAHWNKSQWSSLVEASRN